MSEDEGTNTTAQGVSSEDHPEDGDAATRGAEESDAEPAPPADTESERTEGATDATAHTSANDVEPRTTPETSEDIQQLLEQLSEYDEDVAQQVNSIVEEARDLNATVTNQREELEDLSERVTEQADTIEELRAELEARGEKLEEYEATEEDLKSRLKRKQADFQNYKKRAKKRQQQIKDRATEDLVERLIGVRDNMKRALEEESDDTDSLREGIEMTMREFDRILEDENVSEIDPDPGTESDPQRHEVMMRVDSDQPEGTIADVYTPGYEMGDKVIQNAQVTVSNGELEDLDDDSSEDGAGEQSDSDGDDTADSTSETDGDTGEDAGATAVDDAGDGNSGDGDDAGDGGEAIELGGEVETDADSRSAASEE
ncbi:nucleotide exchange factor GrpE [Natronorubrum daqingense]|uniref:Protein GrpE n=1 Tax=Natronorubrum daqingense TaxID=588898 RepID=A0A1N7DUF0_9EURY|nr:nucleotide exchange factor GrpE [Natronorubrum daqingense]APX96179.1 nucleotide exchange factor GrpE [Natronorubrum daqingense]SIR79411.1 molecular chaperone GrpE [Natronorubrum daqingense]